jgi:UDP-N-acetyl-2-amino-2-deoxyglucuronate dehydrogenase
MRVGRYATAYAVGRTFDLPLAAVHDHLAPPHAAQVADFVSAVQQHREPAVTGRDAVRSQEIVEAVYASARSGASVTLRPP